MAEVTLVAEPGRATGSSESRRLRAAGRIPAVVYGHGGAATSITVDARELRIALSGDAGTNQLLDLRVGGERHLTLAKVIQRHPVRQTVVHVDFQVVRRDEVVTVDVPITLEGEAKAVAQDQGLLEQPLTSLSVAARPGQIPNEITVDISGLQVGDTIRVGQLRLPGGASTDVDPEEPVVVATASSVAAEVAELVEEEQAASEGAAAEGATAEGEAAAGAGDAEPAAEG